MTAESTIRSTVVTVDAGLEVLDGSNTLVSDVSTWLDPAKTSVTHRTYAKIHTTAKVSVAQELSWMSQRIRPYITLTGDDGVAVRWDLGVFIMDSPAHKTGRTPTVWTVEAYDLLTIIDSPPSTSYRVAAGTSYVAEVESIIGTKFGETVGIDQASAAKTLPADLVWAVSDPQVTWLKIVNDLLDAIGYVGIWVDRDGTFRSGPYVSRASRSPSWTFDDSRSDTIMGESATLMQDWFATPNTWVFSRSNPDPAQTIPVEGDGIYTVVNQSDGPASVDVRGWTKVSKRDVDVADQASLVAFGDRVVDDEKAPATKVSLSCSACPVLWHLDTVQVSSGALGLSEKRLGVDSWTLSLDGRMSLEVSG